MRGSFSLPALLLTLIAFPGMSAGQSGTGTATTTVTANPSTITVGGTVGLTATVQPASTTTRPTGTITFLDGTTPLSSSPVALAPNSFASATFPQTFGTPDPTFTPQPSIENKGPYTGELVGDLNGDGVPDLFIYNFATPFSTQTFTSNGKGGYKAGAVQTFSFPAGCSAGGYDVVSSPQLIDLNGDGKADILCGILVAYGNGDGTFAQAVPVPFLSSGFDTAYAADLNGDGKTDILAVPTISETFGSAVQYAFTVFLNQGGGSFASAGTFPVAAVSYQPGTGFFPPIVVDLNNDGKPDIISQTLTFGFTQEDNPQRSVDVLLNNGDGTFGTYMPVTLSTPPDNGGGPAPYVMGSGDVNGDGKPDLILTLTDTAASLDAMVLLGNGDGTFQLQTNLILHAELGLPANQTPAISVEDLNLDGKQDLIFGNGQVALGNGDGTFVLSTPLFAYQPEETTPPWAFPLVQVTLPGSLMPSLVYLLPTATPPAVSVFTPQTSSSGVLSLTTLAVGTRTITAQYSGDANYAADTSAAVTVTVNQAVSTTAVTSSVNPSSAGQSVTLTAKVTSNGPPPTGNVTFTSGSTTLATVALSAGSAVYTTTSFTTLGTLAITASYSGDANTKASSATLSQVITGPTLTLSPSSITFPGQYVGTSGLPLTVTATNPGTAPLTITSVTTNSKDFGVLNACGGSLAAGSSCAIGVFFDPASSGSVTGMLTISDNASGSPQTIPLSGSGQDFSFTSSSSTQTVTPGSTATYTIAVNPIAGFNQTVALSCSGAPTGSTCSLSSNSIALSGSTPASVTVSVTTLGNSATATQPRSPHGTQIPIFFAICGFPGLLLWGGWRGALGKGKTSAICGTALLGIVCLLMAGCGGNSSSTGGGGTPANTYTLTVTGTFAAGSSNLTHSTNLTMVVQ